MDGPLDVVLDEARALIVQPDLLYVSQERASIVRRRVYGPPDIVLEVLSPHPRVGDLNRRLEWFEAYGVKECWVYRQTEERLEIIDFTAMQDEARQRRFALDDEIVSADHRGLAERALAPRPSAMWPRNMQEG